jgi:hypothetical protein
VGSYKPVPEAAEQNFKVDLPGEENNVV